MLMIIKSNAAVDTADYDGNGEYIIIFLKFWRKVFPKKKFKVYSCVSVRARLYRIVCLSCSSKIKFFPLFPVSFLRSPVDHCSTRLFKMFVLNCKFMIMKVFEFYSRSERGRLPKERIDLPCLGEVYTRSYLKESYSSFTLRHN